MNNITQHRNLILSQIQKSFENDLEKAHKDGDMHPNGKWVWVSSAAGGKGDWRTINGRAHKKHTASQGGQGNSGSSNATPKTKNFRSAGGGDKKISNHTISGNTVPHVSLSVSDFKKTKIEVENAPLKLHEYTAKPIEYYDNDGNKKKSTPFISEFYANYNQNSVGGYEAYFGATDSIGTFASLNEAISALNSWVNKMRVKGHPKPKWIYNASKGEYQMNYSL